MTDQSLYVISAKTDDSLVLSKFYKKKMKEKRIRKRIKKRAKKRRTEKANKIFHPVHSFLEPNLFCYNGTSVPIAQYLHFMHVTLIYPLLDISQRPHV